MSSDPMTSKKRVSILILILLVAAFLRFYNLLHDAPYFFDPDERNMAGAITQFRLPAKLLEIPLCVINQINPRIDKTDPGSSFGSNDPGSPLTACNLNPHFFAYGQFPLYLAYISDQVVKLILNIIPHVPTNNYELITNNYLSTSFPSAIFWLRFYSALSSTLTILLVFFISKKLLTFNFALLTSIFTAFTPGLIQAAHFGTTESLLTFFFLVSTYFSIKYLNGIKQKSLKESIIHNSKFIILNSLVIGLALGSKLTGLFFFIPPFISLIIRISQLLRKPRKNWVIGLLGYWVIGLFLFFGSFFFFILSSPYNLIAPQDFKSAIFGYEADVALGRFEAFYTRQFVNTTPVLFQMEKIFPYALGWPTFILGSLGFLFINLKLFIYIILSILRKVQSLKFKVQSENVKFKIFNFELQLLILTFAFLTYFLPNAFLFAKWTRFMTPLFPFFTIFAAFAVQQIYHLLNDLGGKTQKSKLKSQNYNLKVKTSKLFASILSFALCTLSLLPGAAFMSIYTREDVRVTASRWIYDNIPNNSYILFETANVVDIPLSIPNYELPSPDYHLTGISFDFYHIDENHDLYEQLLTHLAKADYFFIPSRRIFANYPRLSNKYPLITKYYQLLFSGALGFEKVAEIASFPRLGFGAWNLELADEQSEETYTVFDHPVIRIYRKVKSFTREEYKRLFEN